MKEIISHQQNLTRKLSQFLVLFIFLQIPLGAWAQDEDYSKTIRVDSKDETIWITSDNAKDILGDGKMSYDATNNVLTLNGIDLACTATDAVFISCVDWSQNLNTLTIHLIGNNTITLGNNAGFFYGSALTFTADNSSASLSIVKQSGWNGVLFQNSESGDPAITPTYNNDLAFHPNTSEIKCAESYNLWIRDTQVTSMNANDIFAMPNEYDYYDGSGLATFAITNDATTGEERYTLTLNNTTIYDYQEMSVIFKYPKLTVHLIGENHIVNGFLYPVYESTPGIVEFTSDGGEENCLIFDNAESVDDLTNPNYYVGFSNCTYNEISDETGWTFGMYLDPTDNQQHLKLYKKAPTTGYDLWIGDTQVTEKNCTDILGDGSADQGKAGSFQYIPSLNKLFITNNTDNRTIRTANDEGLTIYLAPNSTNAVGNIIYTGNGNATLTITTDGNYPGTVSLSANANVISGFTSLNLEQNLVIMSPEDIAYDGSNRRLATTAATIGAPLTPITKDRTITPDGNELKLESGSEDINKVVDDILYTLGNVNNSNGDGYDDGGFIVINTVTTDQQAVRVTQEFTPGANEYLEGFKGLTFMVPAGNGKIFFDVQTLDGYAMKVMVGDAAPVTVENTEKGIVEIPYNVAEPTYVYAYNAGKIGNTSSARGIQKGKMTTVHIKIYTIGVKTNKVKQSNSAAQASGGEYIGDTSALEGQEMETDEEIEASMGDVNGDETVNVADIVGITNAIMGRHSATFDKRAADVNGDGSVNAEDIIGIVNKIIGQ